LGLDSHSKEIPHDSHIKLIDGLSEDSEDHPAGFIPIIERHNARLKRAYLLHEATRLTIEQKWSEGVTPEDIGKFLHSWAPEPYRNKPMPRGMIQVLLLIAHNSQAWTPRDLSNCIIRNAEATDSIDDIISGESIRKVGHIRGAHFARLHNDTLRRIGSDTHLPQNENPPQHQKRWLSDEELWLAIPEGATARRCLTHVPRHSWKLMVESFLALNTNVGSWIHNLERRDMMLLGSLTENIFGFAGTYATKQEASLAPILTGWKRGWNSIPRTPTRDFQPAGS